MSERSSSSFDLTGEFGGFIFTEAGKRRLALRIGEEKHLLKVPRILRRRMIGNFQIGRQIRLVGTCEVDKDTGIAKRTVVQVLPVDAAILPSPAAPRPICPIRVCAKKNCWRSGGRELWAALHGELGARDLSEIVRLKAVNCLDRCKQAPNAEWSGREYRRCTSRDAAALVNEVCAHLGKTDSIPHTAR